MRETCNLYPNKLKRHYAQYAKTQFPTRLSRAKTAATVSYEDFVRRQPDGYPTRSYKGPARVPYFPLHRELDGLDRLADYILADDHVRGLTTLRDPYDRPRDKDVHVPPGEGARQYIRAKLASVDVASRALAEIPALREDAYFNGNFTAIERVLDIEEALARGVTIAEAFQAVGIDIERRYAPSTMDALGPHVKVCEVCGYPFEDMTRGKVRKVCSKECAAIRGKLNTRRSRYGTTELEGERRRMDLEYGFYSPAELHSIETRSERSYGGPGKISRMVAAKERKSMHGAANTVKLVDKNKMREFDENASYTWTSDRNNYKFASWERNWWLGETVTYNTNERELTPSFVECQGTAEKWRSFAA